MVNGGHTVDIVADVPRLHKHTETPLSRGTACHAPNEIVVDSSPCLLSGSPRVSCHPFAHVNRLPLWDHAGTDST